MLSQSTTGYLSAVAVVQNGVDSAAGDTGELARGVQGLDAVGNSGGSS